MCLRNALSLCMTAVCDHLMNLADTFIIPVISCLFHIYSVTDFFSEADYFFNGRRSLACLDITCYYFHHHNNNKY